MSYVREIPIDKTQRQFGFNINVYAYSLELYDRKDPRVSKLRSLWPAPAESRLLGIQSFSTHTILQQRYIRMCTPVD